MSVNIYTILFIFYLFLANQLFAKGIFWEIEGNNSKIYLLGSIHLAKKETYPLDSIIEAKFSDCHNLVLEMDPTSINYTMISRKTMFQDTNTLFTALPKKYIPIFDSIFRSLNIPKLVYNKFKPWFAVLTIMNLELGNSTSKSIGVDYYFLNKVDTTKRVIELESFNEQADFFELIYSEFPNEFITYFIKELENSRDNFDSLYFAWEKGDESKILELTSAINDTSNFEKRFVELILDKRNETMASKIESLSYKDGCYFVVVGAGHLVGEKGIVNILRKRGFKARRLI